METLIHEFAAFGPGWLLFAALISIAAWLGKAGIDEMKAQNVRRADLELKREQRKAGEAEEHAEMERKHAEMEGRIAAQMEQSNHLMEQVIHLMEADQQIMTSIVSSNEILHADFAQSREGSKDMGHKIDHIYTRVDQMYDERRQR